MLQKRNRSLGGKLRRMFEDSHQTYLSAVSLIDKYSEKYGVRIAPVIRLKHLISNRQEVGNFASSHQTGSKVQEN